jgi:mannose-6-phosphate isomerase-like protein (cupin superfamily)
MPESSLARLVVMARGLRAWSPQPALTVNQATLRVVKLDARAPELHTHEIDECYVVLEGELVIEIEGQPTHHLSKGDAFVVRAGTRHRPLAMPQASILLIT